MRPLSFCSFSVGGKSYDCFPSLDVKKAGCRLRASHLFSQGSAVGVRFRASCPCIPPSWRLPSLRRVQRLVSVLPGGSGHQPRGGNMGVCSTWQPVWDQQARVSCGSWWSLSPVNGIHGGFRSAPRGCEPDPSLLCPQTSHPRWPSRRSRGG